MPSDKHSSIEKVFETRIEDIDHIFESYKELYDIYSTLMKHSHAPSDAYRSMEQSAKRKQEEVAQLLYKQGFVLMTSTAEGLIKDTFKSLLIEDFSALLNGSKTVFSAAEIQKILNDAEFTGFDDVSSIASEFGNLMYHKLQSTREPDKKVNFQNVKAMEGTFRSYFGIEFENEELLNRVHRHWQIRHCVIHSDSIIDSDFIENVTKADQLKPADQIGRKIVIEKKTYTEARNDFLDLFKILSYQIKAKDLVTRYISEK